MLVGPARKCQSNRRQAVYHFVDHDGKRFSHAGVLETSPGGAAMWRDRAISIPLTTEWIALSTLRWPIVGSSTMQAVASQTAGDPRPNSPAVTSLESPPGRGKGARRCARCGRDLTRTAAFALGGAV